MLPNLLSALRIALMPALLLSALSGSKPWFLALVAISLSTDALDGFLARRLHAHSDLGRKLDSAADYLTMICGFAGIALLWPEIVHRELPWVGAGLIAFFGVIAFGFLRLGRAPCYHTWASKALAVFTALSLIPLLAGGSPLPFRIAMALEVAVAAEVIAIALIIPWHVGEVPTLWHAVLLRRASQATVEDGEGRLPAGSLPEKQPNPLHRQ